MGRDSGVNKAVKPEVLLLVIGLLVIGEWGVRNAEVFLGAM